MKLIKFTNGNSAVVEDDMANVLIAGGMATVEPPAPKAAEPEGVRFWIGRSQLDEKPVLFWQSSGPGQNNRGGAYTFKAAQETVVYLNGKPHRPSKELLAELRGLMPVGPEYVLSNAAPEKPFTMHQSSGNLELDIVTALLGKRPSDRLAFDITKGGKDADQAINASL